MPYVKTINEDGVVSDIMAVALDPDVLVNDFTQTTAGEKALDAAAGKTLNDAVVKKADLVNGFTQTTPGVNALDAAAGKTLNDSLANYATKSETLRASIIRSSVTSGQTLAAGEWQDYDTGVTISGTLAAYVAQYGGHPKCIIVNIWTSATNTIVVSVYNPSSTALSLGEVRVLTLYKN